MVINCIVTQIINNFNLNKAQRLLYRTSDAFDPVEKHLFSLLRTTP